MRFSPMMRTIDLILVIALIGIVSWTFKVKHDSQLALERVAELEKQIEAEKVEIDLLKSDWSLLTNPARLQQLVERYAAELGLKGMEAVQIATEDELPPFRSPLKATEEDQGDDYANTDTSIKTGSIPVPSARGAE